MDRGAALWGDLEAGTRTRMGGRGRSSFLQPLIVETAQQPGVAYICIVNAAGTIVAHSKPAKIGEHSSTKMTFPEDSTHTVEWYMDKKAKDVVLEAYREFFFLNKEVNYHLSTLETPLWGYTQEEMEIFDSGTAMPAYTAVVAFDGAALQEAFAKDSSHNLVGGAVVCLLAFACFFSLFWAYSFQRSRQQLKDTQALASGVVSSLPLGFVTSNPEGTVVMANDVFAAMVDRRVEDIISSPLRKLSGVDWGSIIAELDQRGKVVREIDFMTEKGRTPISLGASRICNEDNLFLGHLFLLRDVSEVRHLQMEVRRNERLRMLGHLAAGVAHEIRNPLSSIKGMAMYLAGKVVSGSREEEAAQTLIDEVSRLDMVVSGLLEFARPGVFRLTESDMNDVVCRALRLADADIRSKNIEAVFEEDHTFPFIPVNAERCTQALLNLFLNAVHAMSPGGRLEVCLQLREETEECSITVIDNGEGMSEAVQASIFTPYFTTRSS